MVNIFASSSGGDLSLTGTGVRSALGLGALTHFVTADPLDSLGEDGDAALLFDPSNDTIELISPKTAGTWTGATRRKLIFKDENSPIDGTKLWVGTSAQLATRETADGGADPNRIALTEE